MTLEPASEPLLHLENVKECISKLLGNPDLVLVLIHVLISIVDFDDLREFSDWVEVNSHRCWQRIHCCWYGIHLPSSSISKVSLIK